MDDSSSSSVLVPLAAVPNTNEHLPGLFRYGSNNTQLFITGASITSEYNSHETLWFHFFALGQRVFDKEHAPQNGSPCRSKDENSTSEIDGVPDLKQWDEMGEESFLCRVGNRTARSELIPSTGVDSNTNQVLHIWRCPLHVVLGVPGRELPLLSGSDVRRFLLNSSPDVALPIEIMYKDSRQANLTAVTRMHLPSNDPHVGLNRAKLSNPKRPFFHQRHNVTLCVTAFANGLLTLNEFIRYHVDVVGVDHIHLGLESRFYDNKEDAREMRVAKSLLRPEIEAGKLTVSAVWEEEPMGTCANREIPKTIFYQDCLYRGKTTSEWVATWDIDEYFLFTAENARERRLPDFLRGLKHSECQDWSYVTMRSAFAGGDVPSQHRTGLAALDYPLRDNVTNDVWHKSISRTKNVYLNSFHIPGSSFPDEGKANVSDAVAIAPSDGKCAFYVDEAIMIHVSGIHSRGSHGLQDSTVPNELPSLFMSEVVE